MNVSYNRGLHPSQICFMVTLDLTLHVIAFVHQVLYTAHICNAMETIMLQFEYLHELNLPYGHSYHRHSRVSMLSPR